MSGSVRRVRKRKARVYTYGCHDEGHGEYDGGKNEHADWPDDRDLEELLWSPSGVEGGA